MVFYTFVLQIYLENGEKKNIIVYCANKPEEKQSSANIMISVDGKGTAFPVILKLQEKWFE